MAGSHDDAVELAELRHEVSVIDQILGRLDVSTDLPERAELAGELVRAASRYADIVERAVEPLVRQHQPAAVVDELDRSREQVRAALEPIQEATMHVDPRNVHAPDPQGFEDALGHAMEEVSEQLAREEDVPEAAIDDASPAERAALAAQVRVAARDASEWPRPPKTHVGRRVANARVHIDRLLRRLTTSTREGIEPLDT
jgi:hypothetical protein